MHLGSRVNLGELASRVSESTYRPESIKLLFMKILLPRDPLDFERVPMIDGTRVATQKMRRDNASHWKTVTLNFGHKGNIVITGAETNEQIAMTTDAILRKILPVMKSMRTAKKPSGAINHSM